MAQKINFQAQLNNLYDSVKFELLNLLNQSNQDDILLTKVLDEVDAYGYPTIFVSKDLVEYSDELNWVCIYRVVKIDDEWFTVPYGDMYQTILHCDDKRMLSPNYLPKDIKNLIKLYERVYNVLNIPNFIEESYKEEIEEKKKREEERRKKYAK
jgi:hypothetical protein